MAYKEPSNKAKLAKLRQDIIGDGIKASKLDKYVELALNQIPSNNTEETTDPSNSTDAGSTVDPNPGTGNVQ